MAPQVQRKAAERLADLIDPDRVLREAARLAYSDVTQLFDPVGNLLPVHRWPKELAAAVGAVEVVQQNVTSGDGKTDRVLKIRLWDKPKNIELLMRHLGMLLDRHELSGANGGPIETKAMNAMTEADLKAKLAELLGL